MSDRELPRHWAQRLEDLLTGAGTGNVGGPVSSTVNRIVRWGNALGTLLADSSLAVDGSGNVTVPGTVDGRDLSVDGAALDAHVASTSNPHAVTKTQVGLSAVTNDSQLTRAAGDFATFTSKATPVSGDVLLIEDSAASGAKKKITIAGATPSSTLVQTYSAYLAVDLGGAWSDTFTTITQMDIAVTIASGDILLIAASLSADRTASNVPDLIRILVDSTNVCKGTRYPGGNVAFAGAVGVAARVTGLSAGSHTVHVQTRTTNAGVTFSLSPVTKPDTDHCSLVVKRVQV